MTFTLDTSGEVLGELYETGGMPARECWTWEHLSPFEQGCVEALLLEFGGIGFRYLSPEALARIQRDCKMMTSIRHSEYATVTNGRIFWKGRQPYLSDDGKVHLREGA